MIGPEPAWVHSNLAAALVERGRSDEAVASLENAIERDAYPLRRILYLARLNAELKRPEEIGVLWGRARLLLTHDAGTFTDGRSSRHGGKTHRSRKAIRSAIELDSRNQFFDREGGKCGSFSPRY